MARSCVLLGGGGHARVVMELLANFEDIKVCAILDNNSGRWGLKLRGVPILGDDTLLPKLRDEGVESFIVAVGSTGDNGPRQRLFQLAAGYGLRPLRAVHPQAIVSPSAQIGDGSVIMAGAVVNADSWVGVNVIVNTGAIVEHDCVLGNHVHVATGARLASTVTVGDGAHIGAGAVVRQSIQIGEGALVGAGAVVVKDVPPEAMVVGVPARALVRS